MKRATTMAMVLVMAAGMARLGLAAEQIPAKDKALITELLHRLKQRKDLKFVREDKTYGPREAAWYLKFKWDHNKEKVHNVEDFINLSSYGGDHGEITYYVRFSDGTEKPAKEVLEQSVKKLEAEGAKQQD
ncbi:MAG: DUF5329 family protein [Phycisphaerae bacterium]